MDLHAISYFKREAKRLHDLLTLSDSQALALFKQYFIDDSPTLMRVQHVVANEAGFRSWEVLLKAPDAEMQLAAVMHKHPLLCNNGIGVFNHWRIPRPQRETELLVERKKLQDSIDDVLGTIEWLRSNISPIKTINDKHSSYGLKHLAEKELPPKYYITNGVFIAAAIMSGYVYRQSVHHGSPNVEFAMSERSIKAVRNRQRM